MFDIRKSSTVALVVLSAWLALSAFLWEHTTAQMMNAILVGGVLGVSALFGYARNRGAFVVCAALAIWLFLSLWTLPGRTAGLVVHNMLVAVLAFGFSCAPLATPRRIVT